MNQTDELKPKTRASSLDSGAFPGLAEILARESASNEIDRLKVDSANSSNVPIALYRGPVLPEYPAAVVIDFDLPSAFQSRPFQAQIHSTDTGEQGTEGHGQSKMMMMGSQQPDITEMM